VVVSISHALDSWLLFVHPPIAVAGYLFTFSFLYSLYMFRKDEKFKGVASKVGTTAFILTFLGLVTGMIWAQIAWGRPFAFDPKETFTLLLFISIGSNLYLFHRKKSKNILLINGIISCILIILTIMIPLILSSLHGYA
jgi:ABC-type transport system involved in cytochrome c biogenesis permease subunit